MKTIREILEKYNGEARNEIGFKYESIDSRDFDKLEKDLLQYTENRISKIVETINKMIKADDTDSVKYHALCARATLFPNKTIEEAKKLIDKMYENEEKI